MRANQFYFEEKYYLGKKIDYAFISPSMMLENYYTYNFLNTKGEYKIKNIVAGTIGLKQFSRFYDDYKHWFNDILDGREYIIKLEKFFNFLQFNEVYYDTRPTSGIYMCAFATQLGYKEIYIAGIDFYKTTSAYPFNAISPNLTAKYPRFGPPSYIHSLEMDIKCLEFLEKHYDVKFYSICPNSPLSKYIPLAESSNKIVFIAESKPKDYIDDLILPNKCAYNKMAKEYKPKSYLSPYKQCSTTSQVKIYKQKLKGNLIFKVFTDIWHLPSDIFYYIKGRILQRKIKKQEKI